MFNKNKLRRILSIILCFGFLIQQTGFAQMAVELNVAGYLSGMRGGPGIDKFRPLHLRYFSYDLARDDFKFIFDQGSLKGMPEGQFKKESQSMLSYFLIGIALPDSKFWVNLRPDSPQQIIEPELEKTDLGKVLLEADLQLKKDTASMTSPQTPEGREYWKRLYKKAEELYGNENVSIPTLTRPWIVPGEIIVRETEDSAFIYKSALKVMLESDYLDTIKQGDSLRSRVSPDAGVYQFKDERSKALNEYSTELIKELILPKLTREVNSSRSYASLRQVFYSLILSRWFKARYGSQLTADSPEKTHYIKLINSGDLANLASKEPWDKDAYFQAYRKSFAQGEYNVQEPVYTPTGQVIRSYFSGGIVAAAGSPLGYSAANSPIKIEGLIPTDTAGNPIESVGSPIKTDKEIEEEVNNEYPLDKLPSKWESPLAHRGYLDQRDMYRESLREMRKQKIRELAGDSIEDEIHASRGMKMLSGDVVQAKEELANAERQLEIVSHLMSKQSLSGSDYEKEVAEKSRQLQEAENILELARRNRSVSSPIGKTPDFKTPGGLLAVESELRTILGDDIFGIVMSDKFIGEKPIEDLKKEIEKLRKSPKTPEKYRDYVAENPNDVARVAISLFYNSAGERINDETREYRITRIIKLVELHRQANDSERRKYRPSKNNASVASPLDKKGGIDFRVMNIVTQPLAGITSLNLVLPKLNNLAQVDLDKEIQEMKNMLLAGNLPSGDRIKEYVAACYQKGEWAIRVKDVIACLIEICRLQEEEVIETPIEIKEAMVIADSLSAAI